MIPHTCRRGTAEADAPINVYHSPLKCSDAPKGDSRCGRSHHVTRQARAFASRIHKCSICCIFNIIPAHSLHHSMYIQIPRYHDDALCLCLFHGADATAKSFLLITVLLLRYSAAGWPGLWPLRPYLDFGATGAPTFNLGVYLAFSTFFLPFPRPVQSLGLHCEQLRRPCQVWPHIRRCGSLIRFSEDSILDFLTGECPGDCGGD